MRCNRLITGIAILTIVLSPGSASALVACARPTEGCLKTVRTSTRTTQLQSRLRRTAERTLSAQRRVRSSQLAPRKCGNGTLDRGEQCDDGNKADGDGCSSICVIVPEPIRHGALRIEEIPVPDDDVVAGQKGKTLLAFRIVAGRQDVELQGMTFVADAGVPSSGRNYRLYGMSDLDGSFSPVSPIGVGYGTSVSIENIDTTLTAGHEYVFHVRADISSNPPSNELSLAFDTSNQASIHAVGALDGRELTGITFDTDECDASTCWIEVHTAQ